MRNDRVDQELMVEGLANVAGSYKFLACNELRCGQDLVFILGEAKANITAAIVGLAVVLFVLALVVAYFVRREMVRLSS